MNMVLDYFGVTKHDGGLKNGLGPCGWGVIST